MTDFKPQAFTVEFNGRAHVLITPVHIGRAFDHTKISRPPGNVLTYNGIWDTGATNTVITERVARECGLKPIGVTNVETAGGRKRSNVYLVSIGLPNTVGVSSLRVTEGILNGNVEVLIGMDVIGGGDFAITCNDGKTVFSFRFPSKTKIDFVKEINRQQARKRKKQPKKKQKRRR